MFITQPEQYFELARTLGTPTMLSITSIAAFLRPLPQWIFRNIRRLLYQIASLLSFKNIVPGIATLFCLKHNFYLLSSPDLSVLEINKYAGPLDVGRTIFTGVDGDLISTVFERLKISNILAKKEQSVFLKAIPKITIHSCVRNKRDINNYISTTK